MQVIMVNNTAGNLKKREYGQFLSPEWPIEPRGKFCTVAEDGNFAAKVSGVQSSLDRSNPSIHHV